MTRHRRTGDGCERGSVSVELVILTPLLILLLMFVVAFGRLASARIDVNAAAAQAARAASIARDPAAATANAQQTASSALAGEHLTCAHLSVDVDLSDFTPGGSVAVTVYCVVQLADLSGLAMPAAKTISDRFATPIDRYRGVSP